ncbi:hypothetical protein GYB22_10110 [bacterium]|nr:hypothetical protein [bacterium]
MSKFLAAVALAVILFSCNPGAMPEEPINRFSDPQLVKIYDLQDRRKSEEIIPFLKAKKEEHRVAAALAFASTQDPLGIPYLSQMAQSDQGAEARRAAVYALGQIGDSTAVDALLNALAYETETQNQAEILQTLGKSVNQKSWEFLLQYKHSNATLQYGWLQGMFGALLNKKYSESAMHFVVDYINSSPSDSSAILAAHYIYRYFRVNKEADQSIIESIKISSLPQEAQTRIGLLNVKEESPLSWSDSLKKVMNEADVYRHAALIQQLDPNNDDAFSHCNALYKNKSVDVIVRSAALEKIKETWNYRQFPIDLRVETLSIAFESGDMALQSLASYVIASDSAIANYLKPHVEYLDSIRNSLSLPRQVETYNDISKAIAAITGEEYSPYEIEFNHPIDWDFVKTIPSDQKVKITTNKGNIILRCYIDQAPGSVSNFLKLVDSGFYNNKYFHRVVPQFVIQGGCPRGDGWGSLDWTQRSEFSNYLEYIPGAVGLASAGNDTEGVQFFITHCHVPHLNGGYTIFAQVIEGIDVVEEIVVGDEIISIERIN